MCPVHTQTHMVLGSILFVHKGGNALTSLICVYSVIFFIGGAPLILSLILGDLLDFADGFVDSIDSALEGIGIDLIPEGDLGGSGKSGFGTMSLMAFLTLFGGVGLLSVVSFHTSVLGSVFLALLSGVVAAVVTARFIAIMYRMQASGHLTEDDYIGSVGSVSVIIPANGVGRVSFSVKKQVVRLPARSEDGSEIKAGMIVEIVQKEGSIAVVKEVWG